MPWVKETREMAFIDADDAPLTAFMARGEEPLQALKQMQHRHVRRRRYHCSRPAANIDAAAVIDRLGRLRIGKARAKYQDESTKVSKVFGFCAGLYRRISDICRMLPRGMMIERIAGLIEADIVGQNHRQILFRHRHDAARAAMDHRNGTAPITLPRHQPIAQPVMHSCCSTWPAASKPPLAASASDVHPPRARRESANGRAGRGRYRPRRPP